MASERPPKAVLFDIGGVCVRPYIRFPQPLSTLIPPAGPVPHRRDPHLRATAQHPTGLHQQRHRQYRPRRVLAAARTRRDPTRRHLLLRLRH